MAAGDNAEIATRSYVAFGKESTFGTYASATSATEPLSAGFITEIASEKLDTLNVNRGFTKRVQLDKNVSGSFETYLHAHESVLPIIVAMGGGVDSSVTALSNVFRHSITAGNFDTLPSSLSFNVRKGGTLTWRYSGGRVNEMRIAANVGEPVRISYAMVFKDSTQTADDISAELSISSVLPFTFVQGVFQYSDTEANAATTTAQESIQGFELTLNNNIPTEGEVRQLGSNVLSVVQPVRRDIQLTVNQRFDTITAYNRFIQATQGAVELKFTGAVITTSAAVTENFDMTIRLPKVFYSGADPEIGSPTEILSMEIPLDVLVEDPNTTTGKDIGITVTNDISAY